MSRSLLTHETDDSLFAPASSGEDARARVKSAARSGERPMWLMKRGHTLTFVGLYLFTAVLYFRPYELIPALAPLTSLAFWLALATLIIFVPTQLSTEGNLTARPHEINLVLWLTLAILLSMPLAINPGESWTALSESFVKVLVTFIVMVNVVRTERRLTWLIGLSLLVGIYLSLAAVNDFRLGNLGVKGERIEGAIGGLFGNPNDLALHLASVVPLALTLAFARTGVRRVIYLVCALLMAAGLVVTFSRGGFLGMAAGCFFFLWQVMRRNRVMLGVMMLVCVVGFVALAPGEYASRLASIYNLQDDGSASARTALFWKGVYTTAVNPLFGVGFANFPIVSNHEQVTHNSYLEVSAELGIPALVIYVMFIVSPLKRLRQITRRLAARQEEQKMKRPPRFYYLALGLQASIIAYMVSSFFGSVAFHWYIYYLVGYAVCLRRIYEAEHEMLPSLKEEKAHRRQIKKESRRLPAKTRELGVA